MTASLLAPVDRTMVTVRRGGKTRQECCQALTRDGLWELLREDTGRSDWLLLHRPSVADRSFEQPVQVFTRERDARLFIGRGSADDRLRMLKCPHPADARSRHAEGGTFDWTVEDCLACGASRHLHDDDDRCRTCDAYFDGEGPGHDWSHGPLMEPIR